MDYTVQFLFLYTMIGLNEDDGSHSLFQNKRIFVSIKRGGLLSSAIDLPSHPSNVLRYSRIPGEPPVIEIDIRDHRVNI